MNGEIAPKLNVVEAADLVSQRGRRNRRMRKGECSGVLPGFRPPACSQGISCEQGRSVWFKPKLVESDEPATQGGLDDRTEVRLADSTLRGLKNYLFLGFFDFGDFFCVAAF